MRRRVHTALALAATVIVTGLTAPAAAQQGLPAQAEGVGFDQRLGERVPVEVELVDEAGRPVRLGDLLGGRPAVLALVYFECPMLCGLVQQGMVRSLRDIPLDPGSDLEVLAVSFDPGEGPELARRARQEALALYGREGTEAGWHFLTGDDEALRRLTEAVGFRYNYDEARDEWAHASGIVVLTPDGSIARYFFGIEYAPRDLRLGLVEAAEERIGSAIDRLLLLCFTYDPTSGTYSAMVLRLVRVAGLATILGFGLFFLIMWRRGSFRRADEPDSEGVA